MKFEEIKDAIKTYLYEFFEKEQAFEDLYIHELTHDMRHAAGFPCH